ncbi:LacI family DNA-binding transcriptional regulator [Vibrio hannami]|uniref:LacI family DNA-binding transcriptional regulator n=1 Tax=Vibrio hannami TaxID=2717094 RepID=UPI0024103081|nr:LacI family DNA-binding transcriptional regulator [Vibrio hannami]MDG3085203.1 LacI family DNA-binding transcriptional regulator [Vibrio hannami]
MNKKKVTLADIARYAGVSKSTVSFVLNGHAKKHRITEETVQKVRDVVEQHQYAPSVYARALKSKKTYTVGLVIPDLLNMGFATIAKELEGLCLGAGYQLLIASSDDNVEKEKRAVHNLIERQVDLIMVASAITEKEFYCELNSKLPVILFDRRIEGSELPTVVTDARSATRKLVGSMIEESTRECLFFGGLMQLSPSIDRISGYRDALENSVIGINSEWEYQEDYQPESGFCMMQESVENLGRMPDAVFTASYSILEGVLRYLSQNDLMDSGLMLGTFDNYSILDCLPIGISSIEQDCASISQTLFEMMSAKLNNQVVDSQVTVLPALHHIRIKK